MKIILTLLITPLIATWLTAGRLAKPVAEDWVQFRGPNGSGVSVSTGLPEEFGPEKNVVWKTALPPGHSSPVLTRDRIFVTAFERIAKSDKQSSSGQKNAHAVQASPIEKENYKLLVIAL